MIKPIFKYCFLVTIFLFLLKTGLAQELTQGSSEIQGFSVNRLERITTEMNRYVDEGNIPGVVALVVRNKEVVYSNTFGYADIEKEKKMSPDTRFRLASMTKPITSTAVMMLYEEGHFLLSDPVSKFIPEFKNMKVAEKVEGTDSIKLVPAKNPITIRNLLNHTSGITYGKGPVAKYYEKSGIKSLDLTGIKLEEVIKKMATLPLISHPGEEFQYGMSIDVLGYLVEVISGKTFAEFLDERLFTPLGMNNTYFKIPKNDYEKLAVHYGFDKNGNFKKSSVDTKYLMKQEFYAGGHGLISTASDYLKYAQMILNKGEYNGIRFLSPKTVELMTTNSIGDLYSAFRINSGDKFGYGFGIRTERGQYDELESLGILGWDGAFHTRFWIDPKENLIGIFMSQCSASWNRENIANRYRVMVYQALIE